LGFPFNISATTEHSDFKIGRQVRFAKDHHISHNPTQKKKRAWPWARELPKIGGFPINIYAMAESIDFKFGTQFGWPKTIIKSHK